MTDTDRAAFAQVLTRLLLAFPTSMPPERALVYFEALRDLPLDALERTGYQAAKVCESFPAPVVLRRLAQGHVQRIPVSHRLGHRPPPPSPGEARRILAAVLGDTPFARRVLG